MDPWKRRFLLETIISRFQPFVLGGVLSIGNVYLYELSKYCLIFQFTLGGASRSNENISANEKSIQIPWFQRKEEEKIQIP